MLLTFALAGLAASSFAADAPAFQSPVLTRAQVDVLLANPQAVLFIDVRRPDEIQSVGGFPVYLNIQAAELAQRLAFIPRDRTLVTVSNHAARAGKAADLLVSHGFTVAGAVGAQTYEQEGGTLVRVPRPAPTSP